MFNFQLYPEAKRPYGSYMYMHSTASIFPLLINLHCNLLLLHRSICSFNIPLPPGNPHPLRYLNFSDFWWSHSPPTVPKSCSNAPHVRPAGWANAPPLGHFFLRLTGQDCFKTIICYKYQLAFSIHVGKRIFVLPFKCISEFLQPIFGQGDKHNILSAINQYHLTFSLPGGARMLRLQIDRYISNICQHYNLLPDRSLNAFSINNIQCNDTIFCPS